MAKSKRVQTGTMEERAIRALKQTWSQIGYDTLQCTGGGDINAESVIDGVTSCGFVGGYPMMYGGDDEAVKWLEEQKRDMQDAICNKAFPPGMYGL